MLHIECMLLYFLALLRTDSPASNDRLATAADMALPPIMATISRSPPKPIKNTVGITSIKHHIGSSKINGFRFSISTYPLGIAIIKRRGWI